MSIEELPTCGDCPWWHDRRDKPSGYEGVCRRRAPQQLHREWPYTDSDDWCGEHPLAWKRLQGLGDSVFANPSWAVPSEVTPEEEAERREREL